MLDSSGQSFVSHIVHGGHIVHGVGQGKQEEQEGAERPGRQQQEPQEERCQTAGQLRAPRRVWRRGDSG